uniref:Uncharacterized protein n=1 Tax=Magallana gigas TaxID=29159 RepID=K1PRZ9_MAGGI
MAIRRPPAALETVDGDKITTTAAKSKKKPWRLQYLNVNVEETKTKAQEVDSTPNPTKRGKARMKGARKKPYKKSGGEDNKRKKPENDIPVTSLPVLVAPPSYNLLGSESTCPTTETKKIKCTKTMAAASGTADVAYLNNKNSDKNGHPTQKRKHHRQSAKSSVKKRRMIQDDTTVEELISTFAKLAL